MWIPWALGESLDKAYKGSTGVWHFPTDGCFEKSDNDQLGQPTRHEFCVKDWKGNKFKFPSELQAMVVCTSNEEAAQKKPSSLLELCLKKIHGMNMVGSWQQQGSLPYHLEQLLASGPAAYCDNCHGPMFQDGLLGFQQVTVAARLENMLLLRDEEREAALAVKNVWASQTLCNKACFDDFQH